MHNRRGIDELAEALRLLAIDGDANTYAADRLRELIEKAVEAAP
jgi:hypothetical protein